MSFTKNNYAQLNKIELLDVLENKELELNKLKDLHEEEVYALNFILQNIPASIYWKNREGVYLGQNAYAKNLMCQLGFNKTVIGHTDHDIFPKLIADKFREADLTVLSGKSVTIEEIINIPYQKKAIFLSSKIPLENRSKQIVGVLGISIDITKQKQAHIAKQEFLQNMAHDIRTPLSGIIGLSDIQKKGLISLDESKEYGHMIYDTGNQLLELLNAVVKVIDTEHMTYLLKIEPLDLLELIKELYALMKPAFYDKGLGLILEVDQNLPIILSDKIKLKRIFLNILSNAVKFTKVGEIKFIIKLLGIENNTAKIEIRIADTGIGIAKENLDKIFDRFYRAHPSYLSEYSGYGLGLYLVKEMLNVLEGEIKIEGEEGKGSCFTLYFTFPVANKSLIKKESKLNSSKKVRTGPVLIAEDDSILLHVLKNHLEKAGYQVITTVDGQAALEALKTFPFVWALLDIGLPKIKGTDACQQYRQWERENNRPRFPIFALTGHQVEDIQKECDQSGIDKIFMKPFNDKILQEIEQFVNK